MIRKPRTAARQPDRQGGLPEGLPPGLRRALALTRAGMLGEALLRAFWPLMTFLLAVFALAAFGAGAQLPAGLAAWLLPGLGVIALGLAVWGLRSFRVPRPQAARDRLDATMPGRPLATLEDALALGAADSGTTSLWRAHIARMADRAAAARAVAPDLRLSGRDPYALRLMALTLFVVAVLFGSGERALQALDPGRGGGGATLAAGPDFEAWIEPPGYTGRPTLYLNDLAGRARLEVPQGSRILLRLYGQEGTLSVVEDIAAETLGEGAEAPDWSRQALVVARSGRFGISGGRGGDVSWEIEMIPDMAPEIDADAAAMERLLSGEMRLPFTASDDYGVTGGEARILLDLGAVDRRHGLAVAPEPRPAIALDLPLPFRGDRSEIAEVLVGEFAEHPWAELPVSILLEAEDAIGQIGAGVPVRLTLPGRRFLDPLAAAIIEQRRDILWSRENGPRAARVLRMISHDPDAITDKPFPTRAWLPFRMALRMLEAGNEVGLEPEARDRVAEILWQVATLIEDGDLADARERLRRAQERLSEAIERGATESEIAELMDELRDAMREYMRELARNAEEGPEQDRAEGGERMEMTPDQLQELLDRIEELNREGRTEEALALLEQLRQLLENMQITRGEGGGEGGEGQEGLEGLQDTLRGQRDLSDDSFRGLQDQMGRGEGGGEGTSPGELARRQQDLRDQLNRQRGQLPGASEGTGEALERAEREMDGAGEALERGDLGEALDRQSRALDALREGIRGLAEDLAEQQNAPGGPGERELGRDNPAERTDPLGREAGRTGRLGTEESLLPDADSQRRARELQEEIRRRSGERERPEIELDYLRRLLDRF